MKTILMIGDSWGVPNYEGPPGDDPHTHTEYRLRNLGYKVYNCSMNGGSNMGSMELAEKFISGEKVVLEPISLNNRFYPYGIPTVIDDKDCKIDVIIWFHTEFFRSERPNFMNKTVAENISDGAHHDYAYAKNFFAKFPDAKIIIIGGQSIVVKDVLYQYINPDYLIEDWRSEILGKKMPEVHTLTKPQKWVGRATDGKDFKIDILDRTMVVLNAMRDSPDFPDDCHPGGRAHEVLTNRLHSVMQQFFNKTPI